MTKFRSLAFAALVAPLALGLAACDSTEGDDVAEAEVIAPIDAPEGSEWIDVTNVSEYDGYILGNPDAPIKLVEYASLTCPACAAFAAQGSEELKNEFVNSGRVSYELRNQIHGPHDLALATMVRCGEKEAFHPLSDQVWANLNGLITPIIENQDAVQAAFGLAPDQRMVKIAEIGGYYDFFAARGLSADQARQCLANEETYSAIAERSTQQSQEFGVEGTPTFFLNGKKIDSNSWDSIKVLIEKAGAR
ncbi:MAG: thioredoxin domain-containing protein [Altererythrobacter sp.]